MKKSHALLFDLDGTLVDTAPDLCASLNYVLEGRGLVPLLVGQMRHTISGGTREILRFALEQNGVSWDEAEQSEAVSSIISHYGSHIAERSKPYEGAESFLRQAQAGGIGLGVVTNKSTALAVSLLDALSLASYFGVVVGADAVPLPKPAPDMLLSSARELGMSASSCVVVGDHSKDAEAARNAKMPFVFMAHGYGGIASPFYTCPDFRTLPAVLGQVNPVFR